MYIESMISPISVAVLGASNRVGSVGNAVIANILNGGFTGRVYPVNPSSETGTSIVQTISTMIKYGEIREH